ncbi:MAG: hypothetical protein GVY29_12435 [Spirochaetes bacterium]|jgi:hypothetical protein|nr:hypothetical protein [Spirochaetota bacterium]
MRRVSIIAWLVLGALVLGGCALLRNPLGENEGILRVEVPILADYPADGYFFYADNGDERVADGRLVVDGDVARADVLLPAGDWDVGGFLDKHWDDENAFTYQLPIAEKSVTLEANNEATLSLDNPLEAAETVEFTVQADSSAYMNEIGASGDSELVGVFLYSQDHEIADYHFHARDDNNDGVFTGSFPRVMPGEYEVECIASNFAHWGEESVWNGDLSAVGFEEMSITSGTIHETTLEFQTLEEFSSESEWLFEQTADGGTLELTGGELHMKAQSGGMVSYDTTIALGTPKVYRFTYNAVAADVNPEHPKLHVNLLHEYDSQSRVLLTFDEGAIDIHAGTGGSWEHMEHHPVSLPNGEDHTMTLYASEKLLYLWVGGDHTVDPASFVFEIPKDIPRVGHFGFEAHNEVYIDDVLVGNDVTRSANVVEIAEGELATATLDYFATPEGALAHGITHDGSNLWIVGYDTGKIYQVDPGTGTLNKTLPGPAAELTGITWDGSKLWVASTDTLKIYEVDPSDGTVSSSFDVTGGDATGLAFDGTNLWNADFSSDGQIHEYDTAGNNLNTYASPYRGPEGLAYDGVSGNLFNVDFFSGRIYELGTGGTVLASGPLPGDMPLGLTYDGTNFWLTDEGSKLIYKLSVQPK